MAQLGSCPACDRSLPHIHTRIIPRRSCAKLTNIVCRPERLDSLIPTSKDARPGVRLGGMSVKSAHENTAIGVPKLNRDVPWRDATLEQHRRRAMPERVEI